MAGAGGETLLGLERAPDVENGERALIENDGVVLAGLAVGLHDELVVHTGDGPDESGGALLEVDVLPADSEVSAPSVSDDRVRLPLTGRKSQSTNQSQAILDLLWEGSSELSLSIRGIRECMP